ncbi:MAG TPA: nickel-type superoxide dismutase maturation protease [Candidatus Obscuribacterales bacterium]
MAVTLRHATLLDIALWLGRRYRRLRVTGNSMWPLLAPGQEVLIDPQAYRRRSPQADDVVVAQHPQQPGVTIIKRIEFVAADGRCYLKGENARESSDSRQFGLVSPQHLHGRVQCLFP